MIPIRDKTTHARRSFPFVNITIILLNIVIFYFESQLSQNELEGFLYGYGFIPSAFFDVGGFSGERLIPLISSMYLHGGWLHLGSNMLSLWIFGDNVEDRMGHFTYFLFYTLAGLAAVLTQGGLDPTSSIPVVGASGAIAGVMGAYLWLFPRARVVTIIPIFFFVLIREVSALFFILFWFVLQLFNGVMALDPMMAEAGIAWWAHIGGFVVGLLFALPIRRPNKASLS